MNDLIKEFKKLPFNQPIFWAFVGGVSFFAILFGVAIGTTPVEPEVKEVEKVVEKKVEVCNNKGKINGLIEIDNKIILSQTSILGSTAEVFYAIDTNNALLVEEKLTNVLNITTAHNKKMETWSAKRIQLVNELGY